MSHDTTTPESVLAAPLVITRIFDAPRALVWKTWTEAERIKQWWGPKDFTAPYCTVDFREGGRYVYAMRAPNGEEYWSTGVFREIVPMDRIVCTDSFADNAGNVVPASHYGMGDDWPLELVLTLSFEDLGGKTRFTLHHAGIPAGQMRELTGSGWNESLEKFAAALAQS